MPISGALSTIVHSMPIEILIMVPVSGAIFYGAFMLIDYLFPDTKPANLSTADLKSLLQSKIFWIALLNLVAVMLKGLFNISIDDTTQMEIINLDWSNILQGILSLALIVIRKYDILKLIK